MGFIISRMLPHGTNRKSHGQNPGALTKFWKNFRIFQNFASAPGFCPWDLRLVPCGNTLSAHQDSAHGIYD